MLRYWSFYLEMYINKQYPAKRVYTNIFRRKH